jgi:energy-converting hydrogenase Eha subunit A
MDETAENKYPNIWEKNHVMKLLTRIYLFVAILAETALIWLNYRYFNGIYWSAVVGVILAYIYLTLAYTVSYSHAGYRMKIIVGVAGAVLLLSIIDRLLGNYHWSLNYVFPAAILALDVTVLFLIAFNRRNWPSYISFQILMVLVGLLGVFLGIAGVITAPLLSYVALAVSVFSLLGTLIIGGRRATTELQRRFHL